MNMKYYINLAECNIPILFRFKETEKYLKKYLSRKSEENRDTPIIVSEQEYNDWSFIGNKVDSFAEFCLLCQPVSDFLLCHNRCVYHAVAFSYKNLAWIISAGSGVGKSTLCQELIKTHQDKISVINGDKPILRADHNKVMVYPSPWNGKEGWHGAREAKLAGIFLLRRGDKTKIEKTSTKESSIIIYLNIFQTYTKENIIKAAGRLTETIVKNTPIWTLTENDVKDGAELVYKIIREYNNNDV